MAVDSGEYTPETLANRTKIADLLLLQAMKPREIRSPLAGVGQLGEAALGGWLGYKAEEEQKQGTAAQAAAIAALLGGSPPAAAAAPTPGPTAAADDTSGPPTTLVGNNPIIPPAAAPPVRLASMSPEPGIVAPPRAVVPSSAKVVGDDEGVRLGLYEPPKAPGMAPPTPAPSFADRFSAANGAPPPAAPPGAVANVSAALNPSAGGPTAAPPPPAPVQVAQNAPAGLPGQTDNKAAIAKMLQDKNPYVRKMGIQLGTGLIQKQLEGDKPTDEMREYSLYRQQGGKDSFFDYKSGLKKAGAQNIQLNNTINPIVKGVGERFNDSMETAKASIPQIQGIHEARKALDEGAITGLGADPKLFLAKAANLFGLDEKSASNTEVARSAIGNSVLAKAKTLGANPSNTDRDYIEKVVGGQIQLEEPSIRRLLDMQEKWARQAIQRANAEGLKLLKAQPKELESIAPLLSVQEPPSYDEFLKANPRTAAQTATGAAPKIRKFNAATGKIE